MPTKPDTSSNFASIWNSKMGKFLTSSIILLIIVLGVVIYIIEARPGIENSPTTQPDVDYNPTITSKLESSTSESSDFENGDDRRNHQSAKNKSNVIVNKGAFFDFV